MLTKNIKFINFKKEKVNQKKINKLKNINWLKKFPLLSSHCDNYKYSYSRKYVKNLRKYKIFRIIGMGGSVLGTRAIYDFLRDKVKKKFIFLDNLKPKVVNKESAVNLIITKSGETLETISNFYILNKKKQKKNIFITQHKESYATRLAQNIKADLIEHKNYIGGRYSVLSEVGMLPAELMGLNERKFKQFNKLINNKNFLHSLIINVDVILNLIKKGKFNSIIINYDENSDNFFRWYQQLISESLGKKSKGLLPVISSMPKDNHSLLQYYLDGSKKNFYTFFNVDNYNTEVLPNNILKSKFYLRNKKLSYILKAQSDASQNIFRKKKLPFRSFRILKRNEETIGTLFTFFVLETILIGKALKVNPFDQPSVELIKRETKKLIS